MARWNPWGVDSSLRCDRGDDQDGTDSAAEGSPGAAPAAGSELTQVRSMHLAVVGEAEQVTDRLQLVDGTLDRDRLAGCEAEQLLGSPGVHDDTGRGTSSGAAGLTTSITLMV
jgi:hypothetical protein